VELLNQVKSRNQTSLRTYNATISVCAKSADWQTAISLLEELKRYARACAVLVVSHGSAGGPDREQLQPDLVSYSGVVSACGKAGQWKEAVEYWNEMLEVRGA
jgi:pentatricopeptide repeat protein